MKMLFHLSFSRRETRRLSRGGGHIILNYLFSTAKLYGHLPRVSFRLGVDVNHLGCSDL